MSSANYEKAFEACEFTDRDRCHYTSADGRRCRNRAIDGLSKLCVAHERHQSFSINANARAVTQQLLAEGPNLANRKEVRAAMSRLFRLASEKRIHRQDATLLAYIASLVLQALPRDSGEHDEKNIQHAVWDVLPITQKQQQAAAPSELSPAASSDAAQATATAQASAEDIATKVIQNTNSRSLTR